MTAERNRVIASGASRNHHGCADEQARVEPGERGDLARVVRLVDGEQHDVQARFESVALEQRTDAVGEPGRDRDVVPGVGAELPQRRRAVVAQHSGVDRHDESVVDAHARHLQEHVPAEQAPLRGIRRSGEHLFEQPGGIRLVEVGREQLLHAVVGRDGAVPDEVLAPRFERGEVAGERGRLAGGREECGDPIGELRGIRVEVLVGPERRKDPGLDVRTAQGGMVGEIVERIVRGGEHLDPESLQQRERPVVGLSELAADLVEGRVGGVRAEWVVDAEHRGERLLDPVAGRRSREHVPVRRDRAPDLARVSRGGSEAEG